MPTKIEWCQNPDGTQGESINPLGWGCYGPGGTAEAPKRCPYCYAYRLSKRHLRQCDLCNQFVPHEHADEWTKPYHWRKPRRIFVQSMGDLFGAGVDPYMSLRLQSLCWATPRHTYLALTKSPARMAGQLADVTSPPNLWLGVSITNQADAEERIPLLRQVPAAVRWLSVEPLLGPITLRAHMRPSPGWARDLDWLVIGAQTGPGAVPPKPAWIESLIGHCDAAGVPIFVKSNIAKALGWPEVPAELRQFPEVPNA